MFVESLPVTCPLLSILCAVIVRRASRHSREQRRVSRAAGAPRLSTLTSQVLFYSMLLNLHCGLH